MISTTSTIEIVQPSISDWLAYKNLRLRALKEDPQAFGSKYDEAMTAPDSKWQNRLLSVADEKSWAVFAKQNNQLVGMVFAIQNTDQEKTEHIAEIVSMYVAKEARGQHIARQILEALLTKLAKNKIFIAKLSVVKEQKAAVNLYQKMGFKITGHQDDIEGDGQIHTELLMEKKL